MTRSIDAGARAGRRIIAGLKAAGLGLESMHERASLLGGTLKLDTHAKGTTVTLVAPLQPQDDLHYEYSDR